MIMAEKITMLRKRNGWSQEELAEKLGVSRSTYTNYENGNRTPDFEVLERISEVLVCSLDELFGRKPIYVANCDMLKEDSILYNVEDIQEEKPKLAIGVQDFRDLREKQAYYVDKTQFIEQFLEYIVIPLSASRSLLSITQSFTTSLSLNVPD